MPKQADEQASRGDVLRMGREALLQRRLRLVVVPLSNERLGAHGGARSHATRAAHRDGAENRERERGRADSTREGAGRHGRHDGRRSWHDGATAVGLLATSVDGSLGQSRGDARGLRRRAFAAVLRVPTGGGSPC